MRTDKIHTRVITLLSTCMILVTVLCVCVLDVHADDPLFIYDNPQTGYSVYINDAYDLLTEEEEANLLDDMIPITEYGNAGFVSCSNTEI